MEIRKYRYVIQPRDVDITRRITLNAINDLILDAAGKDAEGLGFSVSRINESNWTWVLSRFGVEVERYPYEYEEIEIGTWVGEVNRLMTARNFIVADGGGAVIAGASSLWAMIDIETRLPVDLSKNLDYVNIVQDKPAPVGRPVKIGSIEGTEALRHRVAYSDLDFNGHTNSMKYLQWMIDALPLEKMTDGHISRLDINFMQETRWGQEISVMLNDGPGDSLFDIRHESGISSCRARLKWRG